jgi:hypothetical protein
MLLAILPPKAKILQYQDPNVEPQEKKNNSTRCDIDFSRTAVLKSIFSDYS